MKTLQDFLLERKMSTFEKHTGINPETFKKSKNAKEDWLVFDTPKTMLPIGENSTCITGVDYTGEYFMIDVDGHTDAVRINVFSSEVISQVGKRVNELIG